MISKQKARRIAYGIVADIVLKQGFSVPGDWKDVEIDLIIDECNTILADLKKKSQ